ncbi:hypothetical protein ACVD22_004257 [Vibrio vulnificus]
MQSWLTRRLSGIHAAWHFWSAVSFGGEGGLRKAGLCGIHPLTQRYASEPQQNQYINFNGKTHHWKQALNRFMIMFEERLTDYL